MWKPSRRGLLSAAALTAAGRQVRAQPWTQRTIRLLVPYAAGGGTDVFTRTLAEGLRQVLGQTVVVENRPGANGSIGSEAVARSEPDGQIFLVDTGSHVMNSYTMPSLPYQILRDFVPVALLSRFPMMLVASNAAPYRDVAELVAAAKTAPRTIAFGTTDAAISYAGNLFTRLADIEMVEISYRGAGPMMNDIIAGHLPTSWNSTVAALPHIQADRLRALGVTTAERSTLLPDVPTLAEAGVTGYEFAGWYGMMGPRGLPESIAERMHAAIVQSLQIPAVRDRLVAIGADLRVLDPSRFAAFRQEDDARWARAAREGLITRTQ